MKIIEEIKNRLNCHDIPNSEIEKFISDYYSQFGNDIEYMFRTKNQMLNTMCHYFIELNKDYFRDKNVNDILNE
jgi:hypothetical protein